MEEWEDGKVGEDVGVPMGISFFLLRPRSFLCDLSERAGWATARMNSQGQSHVDEQNSRIDDGLCEVPSLEECAL